MADPLTGLVDRGEIRETARRELGRLLASAGPVALLYLDVDRF